ncbi:MAG: bifunctional DNA primase/polymerase [Planctomycetota bacterium]|jgi:hypothetical protein
MHPTANTGGRQDPSLLEIALEYHRRGWSIISIKAGTKKPPKGFRWSKYRKRQPTEEELRDWFAYRDDLGLAVILGEVSGGLVCRDFDDLESYQRWRRAHRDLARMLPTVETARGRHVYLRAGASCWLFRDLRPQEEGEYRGDRKHYCLLPPSPHPDGSQYTWLVPLPEGDVPLIEDVVGAGLLPQEFFSLDETQKAQGSLKKSQVVVRAGKQRGSALRVSVDVQTAIEEAVAHSMPTEPGTRRKKLIELARRIKFMPEFANLPASKIGFLKPYLKIWWKTAKLYTSGKHPHLWQSWQDFVFAWEEARVPYGATMNAIMEKAQSSPPPRKAVEKYGEGSLRALLASLCRELQRFNGDKPFPLSGRTAGPLLGVSGTQAWRWLKRLEGDGFIEPVKEHPRGKRLATEYRYIGGD